MDPLTSAQDVMRCDLCETAMAQMHCDTCLLNLCKACVGEHISDESKDHKVVKFESRKATFLNPQCTLHDKKYCEMYCEQCDIPICSACIISENHSGHKILEIFAIYNTKKMGIKKENEEMRKSVYPCYKDIASDVKNRLSQLDKGYRDLSMTITKHGEEWHREINKLVNELKAEVDNMKAKHIAALEKHRDEINQRISNIDDEIRKLSKFLESNDLSLLIHYKTMITKFRKLPPKVDASIPIFTPLKFQEDQFHKLFGKLSTLSLTSDEQGYSSKIKQISPKAETSPQVRKLLDEPEIVTTIDTGYIYHRDVACLSEEQIWATGNSSSMKLFNINQGTLLQSIATRSGNSPNSITVTKSGELVYTDELYRSVNIVKNKKIEVFKLQNWKPKGICSTSSGDLLVIMYSDYYIPSMVVCYSGSTEKQIIQSDDKGQPLYSAGHFTKYITENKNLDICVSDWEAGAVVVVNQAGQLRFRYTGHASAQSKTLKFHPYGITTDSQSHILTADKDNDCVHILDQDGQFLRNIYCGLSEPLGLCTDTNDNLFVAEQTKSQVKKIKYLQ